MIALRVLMILMLLIVANCTVACDLEVKIHPFGSKVLVGDPLFIKVTLVNRGSDEISPLRKYYQNDRLSFVLRDPKTGIHVIRYGHGKWAPSRIGAGETIEVYQYLFLPGLRSLNDEFWRLIRADDVVEVTAVYPYRPGVLVLSESSAIRIGMRPDDEMKLLEEWAKADLKSSGKGPTPNDLGVQFLRPLDPEQTAEVAAQVGGELRGLLRFSQRFQELYALPRDSRDETNRELVEWLQKQPDIKRQALTNEARVMVEAYNMPSTLKAIQPLIAADRRPRE